MPKLNSQVLPYFSLIFEKTLVDAFIDTGADLSSSRENLKQSIPIFFKTTGLHFWWRTLSVTGDVINKVGTVEVNLFFASKRVSRKCTSLVRSLDRCRIIGWDSMVMHGVIINVRIWIFQYAWYYISTGYHIPLYSDAVSSNIPARKESVILVRISNPISHLL